MIFLTSRLLSILRSCESGERLPAVHYADRETVGIGLRRGREGKRQERVLVVLLKNDDGAGEFAAPLSAAKHSWLQRCACPIVAGQFFPAEPVLGTKSSDILLRC